MSDSVASKNPARRGLLIRLLSMSLGLLIAGSMIVAMQLPLLGGTTTASISFKALRTSEPHSTLAWPHVGSAAVMIPSLHVKASWHDRVLPIASLTKMMTAYVTLKKFPLTLGASGPCVTVTSADVATYETMKLSDQSTVLVVPGESLCELDLLEGLLVHSASNYASLLANMVSGSTPSFVDLMNTTAEHLGLRGTHYADASGFDDRSVSTALDQGQLAVLLMRSPLVRSIVDQTSVTLPVAGTVDSFTPYVGIDNVIGVKSGRTADAGGCDVMAMTFSVGASTRTVYSVVLDQRGADLLGPAGAAALTLAQSAAQSDRLVALNKGIAFATIGWGTPTSTAKVTLGRRISFWWWADRGTLAMSVHIGTFTSGIRAGQKVGWLQVDANTVHRYPLVAERSVSPLTLWQRLR